MEPRPGPVPELRAVSAYAYTGVVRDVVIGYKEHGLRQLVNPLATGLAQAVAYLLQHNRSHIDSSVALVPIPTRASREFDHSARLAQRASRLMTQHGLDVSVLLALTNLNAIELKHLQRTQRFKAAQGAFELTAPDSDMTALRNRIVIVTDDVITSGATSSEAVRVLEMAQIPVLGIAAVARTPPPRARNQPGYAGLAPRSRSTQTPPSFS